MKKNQDIQEEGNIEEFRYFLNSVNESGQTARHGWIFFLTILLYLVITTLSISHKDLLLLTPVKLPILRIDISLLEFFRYTPFLVLMLHFSLLFHHTLVAKKIKSFDLRLKKDCATNPKFSQYLRDQLSTYFFIQMYAGNDANQKGNWTPKAIYFFTFFILPLMVCLLLATSGWLIHDGLNNKIAPIIVFADLFLITWSLFEFRWGFDWLKTISNYDNRKGITIENIFRVSAFAYTCFFFLPLLLYLISLTLSPSYLTIKNQDLVANISPEPTDTSIRLRGRYLEHSQLDGSDLHRADFSEAHMRKASFKGSWLQNSKFNKTDLRNANLEDAHLNHASMRRAKLQAADLRKASFLGVDLSKADLSNADIREADFRNANLSEVSFRGTIFSKQKKFTYFDGPKFSGATLDGASFSRKNFSAFNFERTSFKQASLYGADFSYAKLTKSKFYASSLKGANFRLAQLWFSDLSFSNLIGANLSRAILVGANLGYADLRGADLTDTILINVNLTDADLTGANLTGVTIWNTNLPKRFERNSKTNQYEAILKANYIDMSTVRIETPKNDILDGLKDEIRGIKDKKLAKEIEQKLNILFNSKTLRKWKNSNDHKDWQLLKSKNTPKNRQKFTKKRTTFLSNLICKATNKKNIMTRYIIEGGITSASDVDENKEQQKIVFLADPILLKKHLSDKSCSTDGELSKETQNQLEGFIIDYKSQFSAKKAKKQQMSNSTSK